MPDQKFSVNYFWSLIPPRLLALLKFGITGTSGLVVDFCLTWLFKDEFHVNKFVANAIGFTAAVMSNYFINRLWTFKEKKAGIGKQLSAFVIVSLIGLLLNSGIIYVLDNLLLLNFYLSKAIAVLLVFFWNFTANYFFVFKAEK